MPAVGLTQSLIERRLRRQRRHHDRPPPSRPRPKPRRVAAPSVMRGPRATTGVSSRQVRHHQRVINRAARRARSTQRFYRASTRAQARTSNLERTMRKVNRVPRTPTTLHTVRRQQRVFKKSGLAGPKAARATSGESFIGDVLGPLPNPKHAGPVDYLTSALALVPAEGLAAKGALALRTLIRGEKGLKTAQRLERTAKAAEEASKARKSRTAAERLAAETRGARVKATATGMGRAARGRYSTVARQARRAQRADRAVHTATNPVVAAAAASPGDIGDRTRAFIEGTATADPRKSLATTGRSIPASLGFLGDIAASFGASGVRATQSGLAAAGLPGGHDYSGQQIVAPIEGVAEQVPQIVNSLAPLVSGDPAKVRQATESQLGYVFAPLLPRGAISRPVQALGRGVRDVASRGAEVVRRPPRGEHIQTEVGALRGVRQRLGPTGRATRKRVAGMAQTEMRTQRFEAARREHELDRALGRRSRGTPVRDLVGVLADYGVRRDKAGEQLGMIRDTIERTGGEGVPEGFSLPVDAVTTTRALQAAELHPEVLNSDRLWHAVELYKQGARDVETSQVAKYREQGRVLGVRPPEERVPMRARHFTKSEDRAGAHADLATTRGSVKEMRQQATSIEREAAVLREKVRQRESTLNRRVRQFKRPDTRARKLEEAKRADSMLNRQRQQLLDLEANARGLRAQAKAESIRAKNLSTSLKPYTKPEVTPSPQLKSIGWDDALATEFLDEVRSAAGRRGFAEPAWTRHADLRHVLDGEIPTARGTKPTGTQHIKTGAAEYADMVNRSYDAFVRGSVYFPRMRRAVARFTRRFLESEAKPIRVGDGTRTVITRDQWQEAVRSGQIDPREYVPLPAQEWGNAVKDAGFDLKGMHTDIAKRVLGDAAELGDARGTRYVVVSREAAREFGDQLNPTSGGMEKLFSGAGGFGSRLILGFSPAWAMVQVGAEGLQMLAAVTNPARFAKVVRALNKARKEDPKGYEAFAGTAGESAGFLQPRAHRVSMGPQTQGTFARAYRTIGRTAFGETFFKMATGELLSQFDRFKGGKFRSIVLAAEADRRLNSFVHGLQGATKIQRRMAEDLKGMPLHRQILELANNPKYRKLLDQHTAYLHDIMGNFDAFTRYERKFGPLGIFYPYVRMSFRWTLMTYPSRHPLKAQMLYLAGQQHAEDMEKLLGAPPDWIHYGDPIIYDSGAKKGAVGILPIGQRISPGLNAFMESVGTGNVAGLLRGANPFIATAVYGITGINPLSGTQDAKSLTSRGLLVLNQLLSMPAPARAFGLNKVGEGEQSAVAKKFAEIDSNRQLRSNVFPYLPQSIKSAKDYNDLQRLLDQAFGGYEITVPQTDAQKAARSEYEQRFPSGASSSSGGSSWRSSGSGSSSWRDSSSGSSSWRDTTSSGSSWRSGG
jgi:hypothetical protein